MRIVRSERQTVKSIAKQFNASVSEHGLNRRGGYHQLKLRCKAPDLKTTKQRTLAAVKAAGFRGMKGSFATNAASPQALTFYVIHGTPDCANLAAVVLGGTDKAPEININFF